MKKLLFIGLVIGLLSCNKEEVIEIHDANTDANDLTTAFIGLPGGGTGICSETFTLYGGQHINVGTITITNTTDSIFVTYTTQRELDIKRNTFICRKFGWFTYQ